MMQTTDALTEKMLVAIGGRRYSPALYPSLLPRGQLGRCFDSCAAIAMRHPQYRYVEGLARPGHLTGWILHAWLTDEAGKRAYDPTWSSFHKQTGHQIMLPVEYIGIQMDIKRVEQFMRQVGYQGIIANRWRNPELAERALQSGTGIQVPRLP